MQPTTETDYKTLFGEFTLCEAKVEILCEAIGQAKFDDFHILSI